MKNKFLYLMILGILLIVPIFVNLLSVICDSLEIEGEIWVGFWGSYLGGFITFLCLLVTIAINKHHLDLEHCKSRVETLKIDLSKRIEELNIYEALEKPLAFLEDMNIDEQQYILLKIFNRYQSLINSSEVLYDTSNSSQCSKRFHACYSTCLKNCQISILSVQNSLNNQKQDGIKLIILKSISVDQQAFSQVKESAKLLIKAYEDDYNKRMNLTLLRIICNFLEV